MARNEFKTLKFKVLIWMLLVLGGFLRPYKFGQSLYNTPTLKILEGNLVTVNSPGYPLLRVEVRPRTTYHHLKSRNPFCLTGLFQVSEKLKILSRSALVDRRLFLRKTAKEGS